MTERPDQPAQHEEPRPEQAPRRQLQPDQSQPEQPQSAEPDLPNDYPPPWQPNPEGNWLRILAIVGGFALLGIVGALVLSRCMG